MQPLMPKDNIGSFPSTRPQQEQNLAGEFPAFGKHLHEALSMIGKFFCVVALDA